MKAKIIMTYEYELHYPDITLPSASPQQILAIDIDRFSKYPQGWLNMLFGITEQLKFSGELLDANARVQNLSTSSRG